MVQEKIYAFIENAWKERAKGQGFIENTPRYFENEVEFFVGAMTALNAVVNNPPESPIQNWSDATKNAFVMRPEWYIALLRGKSITTGKWWADAEDEEDDG